MTALSGKQVDWRAFDAHWYRSTYPLVERVLSAAPSTRPEDVYRAVGKILEHSPNQFFDESWYLNRYPTIREAVRKGAFESGFDHYLHHGYVNASPHWLFDPDYYRIRFKQTHGRDLEATSDGDTYDHFLTVGQHEGLSGHWLFEPAVYAALAPYDVAWRIRREGPFSTYLLQIHMPGPEPAVSLLFDPAWYVARYPSVAREIAEGRWVCALHHYLAVANARHFDPGPRFSEGAYAEAHFDVAAAIQAGALRNGADHFLRHGQVEGRYFLPADAGHRGEGVVAAPRTAITAGFPLGSRSFTSVTFLPCRPDPASPTGSSFGVLGHDKTFLKAFSHRYHAMRTAEAAVTVKPGTFIYGGLLRAHFGHFLLDGIASLWFLREHPELPVLWHWADPRVPRAPWPSWLEQLWRLLGLDQHQHHHIVAPIAVERVILPDPGIMAENALHPKQARTLAVRQRVAPWVGNRVWLSRRGLPAGLGRVEPEAEIEAILSARGWTIIRPEDLPVVEQADIFATAAIVAGCIGSAFHSVLLSASPRAMLILITRPWVPMEYFDAIAQARNLRQVYITPELKPFDLPNQQLVVEAVDPKALADAVCAAAQTEASTGWVHNPDVSA